MNEDITPLHLAGATGWIPGIELLIQIGTEVNARDSLTLETPLHKAARNRELHAIKKATPTGSELKWHGIVQCESIIHMIEASHIKSDRIAIQQVLNHIKANH